MWIKALTEYWPVEFVEDHWYFIFEVCSWYFTLPDQCINLYNWRTGYWSTTDSQHPSYNPNIVPTLKVQAQNLSRPLTIDPQVSSFLTIQTRVLPSFTASRELPVAQRSDSSSKPATEKPSSKQEDLRTVAHIAAPETPVNLQQQEFETLATLVEHVLNIKDRELENPAEPEYPAYLYLVQQAVAIGVNILPLPPLAQPAPQINIIAQLAVAASPTQL